MPVTSQTGAMPEDESQGKAAQKRHGPSRHRCRALALQGLYSLSYPTGADPAIWMQPGDGEPIGRAELTGFAGDLIRGVREREADLNALIERYSRKRGLDRIGRMEAILLRLALYEILYLGEQPKIVISECMELADEFGPGQAKAFVNGILDAAASALPGFRERPGKCACPPPSGGKEN